MKFLIMHTFTVRTTTDELLTAPDLHDEGKRLMEALLDLEKCNEGVADAATSTDSASGVVTIELLIEAPTPETALGSFLTVARTAIHAVGGVTAGWPAPAETSAAEYAPLTMRLEYV